MAEDLKVALKITGDAQAAVSAMGELIDSLSQTKLEFAAATREAKALQKAAEKDPTKAEAYKVAAQRVEELRYRMSLLSNEVKEQLNDPTVKVREGAEKTKNSVGSLATGLKALASNEVKEQLNDPTVKVREGAEKTKNSVGSLATGLKALAGAAVVKEFISANASLESIEKSLEAVTGSAASATREMEFIRAESMRLGVETGAAASSFLTLAAATKGTNLEGEATREIWSAVAGRMTELGASSADVSGAMVQLAQGAAKGRFELEDLKSIAERMPDFFQKFAASLGVTVAEFRDMVSEGKITSDMLPGLAKELGGTAGNIDTFNATLGRMKNALTEVATTIGDTGIFDAITWSLEKLAGATSFATLGFAGLTALIKGDKAGLGKIREDLSAVRDRLFGIGDATKKAAGDVQAMGAQVAATSTQTEQDVRNKIAGSLIKLDSSIKDTAAAFKTLGIDPEEIKTGIGAAEREIINGFKRIAADPAVNGQVLLASLVTALDKVGKEAVPELGFAFKTAAKAGRQSAEEMATGVEILKNKLQDTGVVTKTLADAYKTLGITSQVALKAAADEARAAYDMIVKSGAPLADQAAAWRSYAEAAIAANAGVASSLLQSQAAQHGMTIAIDETGKASVRTKDVLESMADAARRAAQEVTAANTAAMEASSIAASQARTSIGSMQGSIDGFVEHLHGMGTAVGSWVNAIRADMFALSDASLEMFNTMRAGVEGGTIGAYLEGLAKNAAIVTERFNQQAQVAEYWRQRLADGADTARDLDTATTVLGDSLYLLGNQQLDPLRAAIADAERRMLDLRDAAQSTLDSIQDEWDQLNNNLDEIERRRAEKREAEIKAQLAAAQASGDREAIADLQKSLQLLKDITAARIADAKQREKDAATKTTTTTSTTATTTTSTGGVSGGSAAKAGVVNLNISGLVASTPREIAQVLKPEIDKLTRLGG